MVVHTEPKMAACFDLFVYGCQDAERNLMYSRGSFHLFHKVHHRYDNLKIAPVSTRVATFQKVHFFLVYLPGTHTPSVRVWVRGAKACFRIISGREISWPLALVHVVQANATSLLVHRTGVATACPCEKLGG